MTKQTKIRAILYARVSTDQQADNGYSLPTQLEAMREYATKNNFEIVGEYADDYSGASPLAERPEGRKVYEHLRGKTTDAVILYTIDRAARDEDVLEFGIFKRDCKRAGVELHFVDSGKVADTIWGGMLEHFKAAAAAEERKKIIERTMRGRHAKAATGKWVGTGQPYGYRRIGRLSEARLEIDTETSKVVWRIFNMMVGRDGYKACGVAKIAAALSREGIPTRFGNPIWASASIYVILKNPIYLGYVRYKGHEAYIPELAFIPRELFDAAQKKLQENKHYSPRNRKREYLLAGRFTCVCGKSRVGLGNVKPERVYLYYQCKQKPYKHYLACTEKNLNAEYLDAMVWDRLIENLDENTLLEGVQAARAQSEEKAHPMRERLRSIQEEIERDEARLVKLTRAYSEEQDPDIAVTWRNSVAETTRHKNALQREASELEGEISKLTAHYGNDDYIRETIRAVNQKIASGAKPTFQQKRATLEFLQVQCKLQKENGKLSVKVGYVLEDKGFTIELGDSARNSPIVSSCSQSNAHNQRKIRVPLEFHITIENCPRQRVSARAAFVAA